MSSCIRHMSLPSTEPGQEFSVSCPFLQTCMTKCWNLAPTLWMVYGSTSSPFWFTFHHRQSWEEALGLSLTPPLILATWKCMRTETAGNWSSTSQPFHPLLDLAMKHRPNGLSYVPRLDIRDFRILFQLMLIVLYKSFWVSPGYRLLLGALAV